MKQFSRVLCLTAASVFLAAAQSDPPGRVGRLSFMSGEVSFRPGDVDDWVGADINRPLTTGDHLWTDEGARAELHVGSAALRLNARTAFEFLNLDDNGVQIRLTEGSLSIHVRGLADQETFEVDTPNLAFSVLRPGDYRIDVNADNQTTSVSVRGGEGEVTGGGQAFTVHPGEQADVSGADTLVYNVAGAPQPDEFDSWSLARNRHEDQSPSARYVSRDMAGYQDLDDNGSWRQVPDYGAVWVPTSVAPGWAPYHNGHWAWVEPWGWTWVDDAPWGFAPFHYGRWAYVGSYWAWVPGPLAERPVYAPALVAWVGGSNFGVGVSFGGGSGIGWFPLGPREVYVPSYQASPRYLNRVNITNTTIVNNTNITNVYVNKTYINRSAPGGVTAVPQNAFASARPVQSVAVRVDPRAIQSAQVMNTAQVAPSRQSVLGKSAPPTRVAQPSAAVQNRVVVGKATPPPPAVPFAQRQQALTANPGRPLDQTQVQRLRSAQPAPARPMIRQAPVPTNPGRPGGQVAPPTPAVGNQNAPPARDNTRPPQRDNRPANPPAPQNQAPPQSNVPPPRVQRDVSPQQQNATPSSTRPPERQVEPPRAQPRDVQPPARPPERQVEPPRAQPRDVQPPARPPERQVEPPRAQPRDVQPPARPPERQVEPPRPQPRDVQPPARPPERPVQKEAPKPVKKDEKKDKKVNDEKKQ
jgi:hypothetical protein